MVRVAKFTSSTRRRRASEMRSPLSASSATKARLGRPSNVSGQAASSRRTCSSSGTDGNVLGSCMVSPRIGCSRSRPTSTHQEKNVRSLLKCKCVVVAFTRARRSVRYFWTASGVYAPSSAPKAPTNGWRTSRYSCTVRAAQPTRRERLDRVRQRVGGEHTSCGRFFGGLKLRNALIDAGGGPSWTRTTDLTLIRGALSPPELRAHATRKRHRQYSHRARIGSRNP